MDAVFASSIFCGYSLSLLWIIYKKRKRHSVCVSVIQEFYKDDQSKKIIKDMDESLNDFYMFENDGKLLSPWQPTHLHIMTGLMGVIDGIYNSTRLNYPSSILDSLLQASGPDILFFDLGCGDGRVMCSIASYYGKDICHAIGIDISADAISSGKILSKDLHSDASFEFIQSDLIDENKFEDAIDKNIERIKPRFVVIVYVYMVHEALQRISNNLSNLLNRLEKKSIQVRVITHEYHMSYHKITNPKWVSCAVSPSYDIQIYDASSPSF